mgnify:CR=1 FL=1
MESSSQVTPGLSQITTPSTPELQVFKMPVIDLTDSQSPLKTPKPTKSRIKSPHPSKVRFAESQVVLSKNAVNLKIFRMAILLAKNHPKSFKNRSCDGNIFKREIQEDTENWRSSSATQMRMTKLKTTKLGTTKLLTTNLMTNDLTTGRIL